MIRLDLGLVYSLISITRKHIKFELGWIKSIDIFKVQKSYPKKKKDYNKSYFVEYPAHCTG